MPSYIFLFFFTLFDLLVKSQMSSNSKSHTFYQSNEEVRYLMENIQVGAPKDFTGGANARIQNVADDQLYGPKAHLKFIPPVLDFKERYLGVPHHEKVTIINTSRNKTVHMSSISGNTVHFHSSFFQDKIIPPLGNTSFNVVFLGRGEGDIESNLFIHTSEGSFKYQVRGESVGSPYRLRPLSGVRLPLNASYSPLILMHNPHSAPLQLVEVYSSGGDFHLELPSGELEGPKNLWQIPAFLTKPIIRLRFHATSQKNHTAYIRLKVDRSGEVLVVPVEVEVGPVCGLYSPDDLIDFGIGGSEDTPKQINLFLRNSWKKPIRVQNVISMPVSKALKIDFQPVRVLPDDKQPTQVAVLTFDWKASLEIGQSSGRIIIKSNQGNQKLVMAYTATVLSGGLAFNKSQTRFQSDLKEPTPRFITLTNKYKIPVAITNATLAPEAAVHFKLTDFFPVIIMPGVTEKLLTLNRKGRNLPKELKLDSTLQIYSNVSTLYIPLLCYNGRLIKVIPSDANNMELNLGTVGSGSVNFIYFSLLNENPIDIKLLEWGSNITGAKVDAVAIKRGNISDASFGTLLMQYSNLTIKDATLPPGHYCIFQVSVSTGFDKGYFHGQVWIKTKFESIVTPLYMKIEHGSLRVLTDPVIFHNCFPSAVCIAEVRVESQFTVGMAITGLSSIPYQTRLGFVPVTPPLIPPGVNSLLGHITWDMSGLEAYISANANSTGGLRWHDTLELPTHTRELDLSLLTTRYERYLNISAQLIELTLRLDTTEVRNLGFQARIQPAWPSVAQVPSRSIHFPLTQVGNLTVKHLTIFNPASKYPIVVQLVLDPNYPLAAGLVHKLPPSLRPNSCNVCCETTGDDVENVFLISVDRSTTFQSGIEPHKKSKIFYLAPASSISVKLEFKPISAEFSSSILMIRNNLTVLETVQLTGTGAYAQFKFGNRKPGSSNPLLFELNEKHLKDCDITGESLRKNPAPNFTVKRSFTARNTGALPLTVIGFTINGQPCQGFGFRVLNCQPFQLPANSTRKVDIAFTPDFTLTRVSRILSVITTDSNANYSLVATLPPYLLMRCSVMLTRPAWEPLLYYSAVSFMMFLLICVLAAAFFESNRILQNAIIAISRDSVQPVLDLRLVGADTSTIGNSHNVVCLKPDAQYKTVWTISTQSEHEVCKERSKLADDSCLPLINVVNVCNSNRTQSSSMSINNNKKKTEKATCKRPGDVLDNSQDKGSWDCVLNRTNSSQLSKTVKSTSSICITTEPYTPLANIKSRELNIISKTDQLKSKNEHIQRLPDSQNKRNKKKTNYSSSFDESRKKCVEAVIIQRSIEEVETSSTSTDTSSNDDGDREVESMFFRSVRHNLQSKTGRNRRVKLNENSHISCAVKKPLLEKGSSSSVDNEWEMDEDSVLEQGTIVKNNRRPNICGRSRKQINSVRMRSEPPQQRLKQGIERNIKLSFRKDKPLASKKRNDKTDRHTPLTKGAATTSNYEGVSPPPPPVPVWTASFSDVVARSDSTYSSVVALKSQPQQSQPHKAGSGISLEPIGAKRPLNNVWTNWSSYSEPLQHTSSSPQSTANSLFTNSPTALQQTTSFESVWSDPGVMKTLDDQQMVESTQFENQPTFNDGNWPVVTSLWEPLYTPSIENPPVWGSEVWAPPTPRSQTPPEEVTSLMVDRNMDYDPFRSLSNIWAQHSPNIWKPPTSD